MVKTLGVCIQCEEYCCLPACPYFSVEIGASFERPGVEYCRLFRKGLRLNVKEEILRCPECQTHEKQYKEDAFRYLLQNRCQDKPLALRLLKDTKYSVDIYAYRSPRTLLLQLLEFPGITADYLCTLLHITKDHYDQLLRGREYPYLLQPLQSALGFPAEDPLSPEDFKLQQTMQLRRSERE